MLDDLAIIRGIALENEPGLGALTLPGFLHEVCDRYGPREALVMFEGHAATARWTYDELWARSMEVARALVGCGLGKGEYVGILMTNRLEWVSSCFGIALAGGVAVGLSTFSTAEELETLLRLSGLSMLLFERHIAGKDFGAMLAGLEPAIGTAAPGKLASVKFPFLRRLVMLGSSSPPLQGRGSRGGACPANPSLTDMPHPNPSPEGEGLSAIETWDQFLALGANVAPERVAARAAMVTPADPALLFFSSGSTGKPKGVLNAHRGVNIQSWRWVRIYNYQCEHPVRCWSPNGLFWSGNFSISLGGTLAAGGALVLQRLFDPAESVRLLEAERVTMPYCWPHQWAQLEDESRLGRGRPFQLPLFRTRAEPAPPAEVDLDPVDRTPRHLRRNRNLHHLRRLPLRLARGAVEALQRRRAAGQHDKGGRSRERRSAQTRRDR